MIAKRVDLEIQGEVFFASREVGRLTKTDPYIHNTALHYALGVANGNYISNSGPTYSDDTDNVDAYISPAIATETSYIEKIRNSKTDKYITIGDHFKGKNLPSYSREQCLFPGTEMMFYVLGDVEIPDYIRLGKKRGKAKCTVEKIEGTEKIGTFTLTHPIGVQDTAYTPERGVVTHRMRPTPLVLEAQYSGEYIDVGEEQFPADVNFLKV